MQISWIRMRRQVNRRKYAYLKAEVELNRAIAQTQGWPDHEGKHVKMQIRLLHLPMVPSP